MRMPYSEAKRSILFWKNVSRIISVLFHPLLLPTLLFMLLARYASITLGEYSNPTFLLSLIFIFTFVVPLLLFMLFITIVYGRFSFDKLLMEGRRDRVIPFLFIGIFYCAITVLLYNKNVLPGIITFMIACMSLCILIVGTVSLFWKVSAHAAGIAGVIVFMIVIQKIFPEVTLFNPVIVMIVLAGFILSARLYLKAHTLSELLGGCIIGTLTSSLLYLVLKLGL